MDAVFNCSQTEEPTIVSRGEGVFDPREVQTSGQAGDKTIVTKGLKAGERIVISAGFLIDSESQLQAAAGAFNPPPEGAGEAVAMNQTAATQAKLELTTQPDPPRKGNNVFRVKLTDDAGSPMPGSICAAGSFYRCFGRSFPGPECDNVSDVAAASINSVRSNYHEWLYHSRSPWPGKMGIRGRRNQHLAARYDRAGLFCWRMWRQWDNLEDELRKHQ